MLFEDDLTSRLTMPPHLRTDTNNNHTTLNADSSSIVASTTSPRGVDKHDKYSLRPRSTRRKKNPAAVPTTITTTSETSIEDDTMVPSTLGTTTSPEGKVKRASKPKQKPAPLSKYRRRTANARERSRMKEINTAFETLRQVVPQLSEDSTKSTNEKLTKITTLRLAMKYITTLSATLNNTDLYSDLDMLLESDGESLPLNSDFSSDQSLTSDFSMDFDGVEDSLNSMDLCLEPLSPCDLPHHISSFDPFLSGFS